MGYARWATKEEVAERLRLIDFKKGVEKSGMPMAYTDNHLYADVKEAHNLIIGSTGSGKTQAAILPMIKMSMLAGESIVINDSSELYKACARNFKENGYDIVVINFDDAKYGNNWNPLTMAYELYHNNNKDRAIECLEDIAYYLFYDRKEKNTDPFWINSTINYFTGLVLYLFDNAKLEEIHLESVASLSNYLNSKENADAFMKKLDNNGLVHMNLVGTLAAPPETRGSILSVFNQKIKKYISRVYLSNMLSISDFELKDISNKKTALFIIGGNNSLDNNLIPLLIHQIIDYTRLNGKLEKNMNILLDEFDNMVPIRGFSKIIDSCRAIKIKITVAIKSYIHLHNMYSPEEAQILKMCFGNIIFLLSDDIYTLEEISKYCGDKEDNKPLIAVEELKTLKPFEGIVIMPRTMPFKTVLLPDYKIDYGFADVEMEMPRRQHVDVNLYKEVD